MYTNVLTGNKFKGKGDWLLSGKVCYPGSHDFDHSLESLGEYGNPQGFACAKVYGDGMAIVQNDLGEWSTCFDRCEVLGGIVEVEDWLWDAAYEKEGD